MSPQTATCLNHSQRGSQGGGREGHLRLMVTRLPGTSLSKGITSSSITAMQCECLVPYEMKLESVPPEKAHTTQPKQQGRSTEKPTRIESIRNIPHLSCYDPHRKTLERAHLTPKEGWWCNWFKVELP